MHQPFLKSPLYIVSLGTFTIFDKLLPFCFGQQIPRTTFDNDTNPASQSMKKVDSNNSHTVVQPQKLYIVTLTSNYIVTMTSTSYSYSSLTTTITGSLSSPTVRPATTAALPSSSSPTSSSDTAILIGSLVGGITGILLIGIGIYLFFRNKDRTTTDLPPSSSSFYIDPQDDYRIGGIKRISYGRAFVPPLGEAYPPSLSTPATSIVTSNQIYHTPGYPYHTSETFIPSTTSQQNDAATEETRHVPDETDQPHGIERHVPHLVD